MVKGQHLSINSLLVRMKSLRQRKTELESLRSHTTNKSTRRLADGTEYTDEPLYDVKNLDIKIVRINNALMQIDEYIKESNARTTICIDIDFVDLMSEII